jgi:hypothetical protein
MRSLFGESGKSVIRLGYGIAFDTISSFQVTAAAGRIPGLVQSCTTSYNATAGAFTSITAGCVNSPDINKTVAGGFPTQLPAPSVKPSSAADTAAAAQNKRTTDHRLRSGDAIADSSRVEHCIQRELPWGLVGQASYIGRRGEHLFMAYDIKPG